MLNQILLSALFSNLVSGFQFVAILNYFSTKSSITDVLKYSALALLFNRIGRLIAVTGSLTNSETFKKNDHLIFALALFLSFIFQFISTDLSLYFSAFFLGVGMSGTTIAQRWRITDIAKAGTNLYYSINSIAGWGLGVILPSILIYFNLLRVGFALQFVTLVTILVLSVLIRNNAPEKAKDRELSKDIVSPIMIDMRSDQIKYFYVFFSAFIVACSASIFNGMLISLLKNKHQLNDLQVSLSFLLNLLGSLILFIYPKIVEKRNPSIWLSFSNLGFLLLTLSLFINFNVVTIFLILFFIGTVNTISSTFQLDIISSINPYKMSLRRIHVFTELFAIFGGALIYFLSKYDVDTKIQITFLFVVAAISLIINVIKEKRTSNATYKMRLARGSDLDFLVDLYNECEDQPIGQKNFPEERKLHFSRPGEIVILLNPPIEIYNRLIYYILEDSKNTKVGCITNLRNENGYERLGMLLTKKFRGKGLGSIALLHTVSIRKQFANKITGIIAEKNIACIRASGNAGAKIVSKFNYLENTQNFLNVEFFNRGSL